MKWDSKPMIEKKRLDFITKILRYIAYKKEPSQMYNPALIRVSYEKVKNYSIEIFTIRYNGELWLREFPSAIMGYPGYRYESPFITPKIKPDN